MQSPPLELVLDVVHLGTRNLVRARGDADEDTISEITRGVVVRLGRWGPPLLTVSLYGICEIYRRHILNPLR